MKGDSSGWRFGEGFCATREVCEAQSAPGGTHAEPSAGQGMGIAEIHKTFAVDEVADAYAVGFDANVTPLVGYVHVCFVGIFLQDGRHGIGITPLVGLSLVSAETCRFVVVTAIAQIIQLQGVTVLEDALSLLHARKYRAVLHHGVGSHPEAVEVAHAVSLPPLVHQAGVVFDDGASLHLFVAPDRHSLGRNHFESISKELESIVGRLAFDSPMGSKCLAVEVGRQRKVAGSKKAGHKKQEQSTGQCAHDGISVGKRQKLLKQPPPQSLKRGHMGIRKGIRD